VGSKSNNHGFHYSFIGGRPAIILALRSSIWVSNFGFINLRLEFRWKCSCDGQHCDNLHNWIDLYICRGLARYFYIPVCQLLHYGPGIALWKNFWTYSNI